MPVNTTGIIISSQHATRYYTINNWALCEQVMQRPLVFLNKPHMLRNSKNIRPSMGMGFMTNIGQVKFSGFDGCLHVLSNFFGAVAR